MKSKRILSAACLFAIILSLCVFLGSCKTSTSTYYVPQENISYNYNNICAQSSSYWLENDAAYSLSMFSNVIKKADKDGLHTLVSNMDSTVPCPVKSGDLIYLLDITDPFDEKIQYTLKSYNVKTDETKSCVTFDARSIDSYIILGDYLFFADQEIFYEERMPTVIPTDLKCVSIKTGNCTTVAEDILGFGVVNEKVRYVFDSLYTHGIYEYDTEREESALIGEFTYPLYRDDQFRTAVNFTSDQVIFILDSFEDDKPISRLVKHDISSGKTDTFMNDVADITYAVAFEKYVFVTAKDPDGEDYHLFRVSLDSLEAEDMGKVHRWSDLFVSSDDTVYIANYLIEDITVIERYTVNKEKEAVMKFKGINKFLVDKFYYEFEDSFLEKIAKWLYVE